MLQACSNSDRYMMGGHANDNQIFVLVHVDAPQGENRLHYRVIAIDNAGRLVNAVDSIGRKIDMIGHTAASWVGGQTQGVGAAIGKIDGIDKQLVTLTVDNPPGENQGYVRVTPPLAGSSDSRWCAPTKRTTGPAPLDTHVWKSGATTEVLDGVVTATSGSVRLSYRTGAKWLDQQLIIEPAINGKGDSGSLVIDQGNTPVGLIVGAGNGHSVANCIDAVLEDLRLSSPYPVPGWIGSETQGAGIASVKWPDGTTDLIVVHVDNAPGANRAYYRHGTMVDSNGQVRSGWSAPQPIGGWLGAETQGAGVAVGYFRGDTLPSLFVLHVDKVTGGNRAYLHVGRGLKRSGQITGQWQGPFPLEWNGVNVWWGTNCQGADIAMVDLDKSGNLDIVILNIDSPGGGNRGYYRVGRNIDPNGRASRWSDWMEIPGGFGTDTGDAGIVMTNLNNDDKWDIVVFHVDQAGSNNLGYYRIGWDVDRNGHTRNWSAPISIGKWWGDQTQGAGVTMSDLTGNKRPDMILLHVDNPQGENTAYYRVVYDLMPNGEPARWTIA